MRLMKTKEDQGNLTYFPGEKWRREHSGTEDGDRNSSGNGSPEADQSATSGEVLLKTLE